ncbi:dTDP-4-dehydrorhamnose 3,5-epimerase [Polaribacter sp. KT 15]|uniref:dTDP-4-dehydrorhamnose 3,5-epimerase n=1 Tax=Polaribacter sp. KT 15 TaxID=1896175 RepID=UPI00090CA42A|nr:dTDP-4-dehydrorhamnose 3,5-epimerase [Polaribacter sp. KT 15]SHN00789.1 dTDP-4-dehydrorhamnose 3,5-epimerase [Polaribacter sp. KT 15]
MKFTRTEIPDVIICDPNMFGDDRGYFIETFRQDKLEDFIGYKIDFCQDNESKSTYGVLRGLHYQMAPHAQTKLVRVINGRVLDVAVDIREGSPTFGKHVAVELTEENKKQLLVPRGFAHGFVVLSETAVFAYKVDNFYSPECDRGIAFDDKNLNIDWKLPLEEMKLSDKDNNQPSFKQAVYFNINEKLYV